MNDNMPAWEAATLWHRSQQMTELETAIWRSEQHPQQSATLGSLLILDETPSWSRLREAHEWATRVVARARQRVLEPALPTTAPAWVEDEAFYLDYHLRRRQVTGGLAEALEVAQLEAMTPFDRSRPLWTATLIEGLPDGRCGYFLKLHHSMADGRDGVELLSLVTSRTREHTDNKPIAAPMDHPTPDPVALSVKGVSDALDAAPELARGAARLGWKAITNPGRALSESVRFGASVRRMLDPQLAPPSPLLSPRDGRAWHFIVLDCPVADLKAAGKTGGGSMYDAFAAALLGGLQRYHDHHGVELHDVPVSMALSLSRADDPMGGGKFAGAMLALPADVDDVDDRIAAVRGEVFAVRTEPALLGLRKLAPVANRLPAAISSLAMQFTPSADLAISSIPGVPYEVFMAGARIEKVYPFGPLPGVAVMAAMVSHNGTACIGLNVDATAVPDTDVFAECMAAGLSEVLGA
ncbi:MAG: wax ester/triacylglycerol synthase domain-containing protein [Marmoricola sp.]|jgi:WS/DGAT/MGAT family acyltransferase